MAEVQAVKSTNTINLISHLLEKRFSKQMSDIWNIGLNLALRISDLLSVQFKDIQGDRLVIKEGKTGKLANTKYCFQQIGITSLTINKQQSEKL